MRVEQAQTEELQQRNGFQIPSLRVPGVTHRAQLLLPRCLGFSSSIRMAVTGLNSAEGHFLSAEIPFFPLVNAPLSREEGADAGACGTTAALATSATGAGWSPSSSPKAMGSGWVDGSGFMSSSERWPAESMEPVGAARAAPVPSFPSRSRS